MCCLICWFIILCLLCFECLRVRVMWVMMKRGEGIVIL